jgi:hypothetical protein
LLVLLALAQFVAFGYASVLAQKAADSAALAGSRDRGDPLGAATRAARARLPDSADFQVFGAGGTYTVAVGVPSLVPGVSWDVRAKASATATD